MNIKEYVEAAATTQRSGSSITHRVRFAARDGEYFNARFSRKWQLMYSDAPRSRYEPLWLSRYNGARHWEPMVAQWWRDHGGISNSMFSIDACNSTTSEIMSAVTRYGHAMIAPKESQGQAYISCLDGKSGVVSNAAWGVLVEFKTLRELRGWLGGNVSYVAKSTRSKLCNTLGEWLASIADTEILHVNMRDQEVPMYLRSSDVEEMPGFPGWKYDSEDGGLKQNIERIASLSEKRLEYGFNRQLGAMLSSRIGRRTVRLDATRKLAWVRGAFGDERSCFWTSATKSRNMLQDAGCYALRFYDLDGTGVGRCWALPRGDAIAIFNAYGRYQLHEIAAILEHLTGHEARRISYSYANIYINNETVYGFNYPNRLAQFNADLNVHAPKLYSELANCGNCGALLNPTGAEEVPDDKRCPPCHAALEQRQREDEEYRARQESARVERMAQQAAQAERAVRDADYYQMCIEACHRAAIEHPGPWYGTQDLHTRPLAGLAVGTDVFITATHDFWNAWYEMPEGSLTDAFRILMSAETVMGAMMGNAVFRFERRPVELVLPGRPREAPVMLTQVWVLVNRTPM